jgi:chloramphenicol O-acetyltransferase type B
MQSWKRAMHCQVFRNCPEPAYCISLELDITRFLKKVKELNLSFTFSMIYAVSKCANEIEEFRYRFVDSEIVLFDRIDTAFTYLQPGEDLFQVVQVPMTDTLENYVSLARRTAASQTVYFTGPLANDVFQFSPLPWISYTHISHTNSGKKENATPLFDWGKYFERNGQILLPFSVQVHHSFVDGIHVGTLVDSLQKYLNS